MISKLSLVALATFIGLSTQQACVTNLDCSVGQSCYSVYCSESAPNNFQQCLSDISLLATDCMAQPVSQARFCSSNSDCLDENSCCMFQTCTDQQFMTATDAICGTKEMLGAFVGGCQWESYCLDSFSEITDANGTLINSSMPNATVVNASTQISESQKIGLRDTSSSSSSSTTTTFDFSSYTCDSLTCEDYTSLIGTPTCCATIENCQTDTNYNGGYFCVPSYDAFGQAGLFMDPDCTATCNDPDEAICTSTAYSGDATSECAVYGDSYCCMVIQDVDGSGQNSNLGTCNKSKDVDKDQKDGEPVLCGAVYTLVSSISLMVFSSLLF